MRAIVTIFVVFLWSIGIARATDEIPGSVSSVAGWRLGAYAEGGKFSHCSISMPYRSGIMMLFAVSNDFTWRVAWTHQTWNFTIGQSVGLQMYFDGASPYNVTAIAKTKNLAMAELPSNAAIFDAFRKGYQLIVYAQGNKYGFNLDGTYAALTEVLECTRRFTGVRPAAPPPPIASISQPAKPPPLTGATAEQRIEATAIVANILGQGELSNFRILTQRQRKELDADGVFATWDVIWQAEDIIGTLRIVPKGIVSSASEIATAMIAGDSKNCKGKFASASMPDENSSKVVRLFTGCDDKSGTFEYRYTVVPLDDGSHYLFATIGKSKGSERSTSITKVDALLRSAVHEVLRK